MNFVKNYESTSFHVPFKVPFDFRCFFMNEIWQDMSKAKFWHTVLPFRNDKEPRLRKGVIALMVSIQTTL